MDKNVHKSKVGIMTGVLKKLDRVTSNEDFIKSFPQAHAKFLPYIISDHSPAILCVPFNIRKKVKSFRFSNYITNKQEFIPIEATLVEEFYEAESDEEKFLHQQAKIKWLCDGEKNSKYFHRVLKGRSNKRKVFSLRDDSGNSYEQDQILNLFLKHFKELLGSTYPVKGIDSSGNLFKRKLSVGDADKMITNVSDAEIKRASFDIDDSKALGPDGFTAAFCKKAWSIIGVDTCNAVREFFSSGKMLEELNATLVSLIPKVLTNRIKTSLRNLVSFNQSAFILGRHSQDNILLTQEIMRGYNRKGGPKRVAFKIMQCVSTTAFTLNINRDRIGYFKGGRGLRQGDLISPYLCTLIMEVFSLIMQREIDREPLFQYHFGCKNLKVSHVCFADDLLVMCHGDATFVSVIKKALDEFSTCSGLLPNNSKSTVFFGSINKLECSAISNILPLVTGKLPVRYLGVPLIAKRMGASVFLLPASVIKDINRLLKSFLWNQNDSTNGKAKVAWSSICKPKDQIGLGLRNLKVKWVHFVKLRGKIIWEISADKEDSWGWKNLLEIRDQIKDYVVYKIGDEGEWKWPSEWHHKFPMITSLDVPAINTDIEDKIVESKVSMKKDGLGNHAVNGCSLCLKDAEDLQHLFFQCPFSTDVWDRALLMTNMRGDKNAWQSILHGMSDAGNGNNVKSVIRRLLLAAYVIKNKLSGITVKASNAVSEVEKQWQISYKRAYQKPFNGGIEIGYALA
ncbi:RNA-directed DNA polymerase, eukaryota, reverse transcriptase zinc-binding domain protein [Tanacetum coccineum]